MNKNVEILKKEVVFDGFFTIEQVRLRHERYDGKMSPEITRLKLDRGDSVAAVVYNPATDSIVLVEQFRLPAYEKDGGWLLELPAGVIEPNKDPSPEGTIRKEIMEEIGYEITTARHFHTFYTSPGGSSERIYLFYVEVSTKERKSSGGGVIGEGEDIKRLTLKVDDVLAKMSRGEIIDAKTIIGLQWLQMQRVHK